MKAFSKEEEQKTIARMVEDNRYENQRASLRGELGLRRNLSLYPKGLCARSLAPSADVRAGGAFKRQGLEESD